MQASGHRERRKAARVLQRLSPRFSFFDEQSSSFRGLSCFSRRISFDVNKRRDQRNLNFYLFAMKSRRSG